ncbi:MAG: cytochrome c [Thalassovita sp.]|nr:cytochrome c [Thalassovita sp.]
MKRLILLPLLFVAACVASPDRSGQDLFNSYCVACHGASGRGDGALAAQLAVAPADLTRLSARNGGRFPRDHVMATIYGYPGKFQQGAMPEFGALLSGPVRLVRSEDGALMRTPSALIALSGYLETLQRD